MLQTEQLRFELYEKSAKSDLYKLLCTNQKVMSTALAGKLLSEVEFENLISKEFCKSWENPKGLLQIVEKESNCTIGISGILDCKYIDKQDIEFGFILDDQYWGKGYATEIGRFWIDFVLNKLGSERVLATTHPKNEASNAVLKKLKMNINSKIEIEQRGERIIYILEK